MSTEITITWEDKPVYKTVEEANERAKKIEFYLGTMPLVLGHEEIGYRLTIDSPLVPGFKGRNPYGK